LPKFVVLHQMLSVDTGQPLLEAGTLRYFNSILIPLSLEKNLSSWLPSSEEMRVGVVG